MPPVEQPELLGIHHVTAICRDGQANLDFYAGILGLRLVKLTVNFDDPSAHHLYYGDGAGSPGTILTFFPYPKGHAAIVGAGQVDIISLSIPAGSIDFWASRLGDWVIERKANSVHIKDPDGIHLQLVETAGTSLAWDFPRAKIGKDEAIIGIHSVRLQETGLEATASLLTGQLGFSEADSSEQSTHFTLGAGGAGRLIEVVSNPKAPVSRGGPGSVHHVAFRTRAAADHSEWKSILYQAGIHTSPMMDRDYFHSVYFREPGGVLFEIATDPPGFTVDEPLESLGTRLCLPFTLEGSRADIEARLPYLELP